jgi:hypothetical protein
MSPSFQGGPLDGQSGYAPGLDPAPDQGGGEDPASKFDRILADARELAASDGNFSEADKLVLEQITTLLQKLKAQNEKDQQTALSGKMSPAVGKAYG